MAFTAAAEWAEAKASEIVKNYKTATAFAKADGAKTRLESVGKAIRLKGKKFGSGTIEFLSPDNGAYLDSLGWYYFKAGKFEEAKKELEAKGVEFHRDTLDTGVCHMAFFADPDGNEIVLHRRYAPHES